ncbi:BREX-1 system adenine-specific DNA-methyltransferase PglX [Ligilactobacillus murinus]|uniref:BREX-1 system adenine-specific DNA-methyltransferase PglX n=2 Tax=Ligilactobacillus murinus TaxID=1622 RepID=UPI001C3D826D|nr:BREX-1 system adenine-specific DNA-methyltransferase PglX [Ligilactobacillus murinus]
MDKKAIKDFAVNAREKLRSDVTRKLVKLGITATGVEDVTKIGNDTIEVPSSGERFTGKDINSRKKLIEVLKNYENQIDPKDKKQKEIAFDRLVEEVAYTWFNRLVAIRFMEVNNYLPGRLRVLSSESGVREPDIITNILSSDLYSEMDVASQNRVVELMDDNSAEAVDELYQLVFIKQCNSLNKQLPDLFEHIDDYTELLFTVSYIDDNGVIANLLKIPESDFNVEDEGQVEIIGWMYQYYNTEPKDKVFARGRRKIRADEIPAATQLFTPDWIVRYMVENSLGRYYIDKKLASPAETRTEKEIAAEFGWEYYLPAAEQPEDVKLQIMDAQKDSSDFVLQELKLIDPSMGSGHILVYAFDVLIQLYVAEGFRERDAVELILRNNLYGLDIDKRAFQLAYFALMMKARQYSRRILNKHIKLNVYTVPGEAGISESDIKLLPMNFPDQEKAFEDLETLVTNFKYGSDLGSLIEFKDIDFENLKSGLNTENISLFDDDIRKMVCVGELLQQKYDIAVTNPPYMGSSGMNKILSDFVKKYFPNSKSDLFGVFMERLEKMVKSSGYYSMITQHAWMFLSSFEKLRNKINKQTIVNMLHLGTRAFEEIGGEVVQTTAFVISPADYKNYSGSYVRLVDFENHKLKEEKTVAVIEKENTDYLYTTTQNNFTKIPGQPISYWVSENLIHDFVIGKRMDEVVTPKVGLQTGDNNYFLREWWEVEHDKIKFDAKSIPDAVESGKKWFPYNKGGSFRRWYGNYDYVVNWENDGQEIRNFVDDKGKQRSVVRNPSYYFKEAITWPLITSGGLSVRYREYGSIHDVSGMSAFSDNVDVIYYIIGMLNTPLGNNILRILNPTINSQIGDFRNIPVIVNQKYEIINFVQQAILLTKEDWDLNENTWNFKISPLI